MTDLVGRAEACCDRLRHLESGGLNATLAFDAGAVRRQAGVLAERFGGGEELPLDGLMLGVKDNICTVEYPTTCASRMLEGYRSPYEATAVARLKAAGAVVSCTTNLDEFGMGSSTEHSAFGPCRHPTHPDRVPGGSSGGSAALVAAGGVDAALGSETGGSVRQPAAFCGVVGFKPSYGRVSRHGLVAFGSSLDQIGVLAPEVAVAARLVSVMSGADSRDSTCLDEPPVRAAVGRADMRGLTVGIPQEYFPDDLDRGVRASCDRAIGAMRAAGAAVRPVTLPHTRHAVPAYYVIAPAEASSNLARYDGVRYGRRALGSGGDVGAMYRASRGAGFGPEVRRRILIGTYVLSAGYYEAYYRRAQAVRGMLAREFQGVFASGVDVLFTPTTPTPAFRAGQHVADPVAMYLADRFVCAANLAGIPAVSVPIGRVDGLPVGGQLMAPAGADAALLDAAAGLEVVVAGDRET